MLHAAAKLTGRNPDFGFTKNTMVCWSEKILMRRSSQVYKDITNTVVYSSMEMQVRKASFLLKN